MSVALLGFNLVKALVSQVFSGKPRWREFLDQMVIQGVQSLPLVMCAFFFVGFMLIVEFSFHMKLVLRQDSLVPAFSTVLMVRELGPVMCAMFIVTRVGAGLAAEVALMKQSDQLDALKVFGVDPVEYLLAPRFCAGVVSSCLLTWVALGTGVWIGAIAGAVRVHYPVGQFLNTALLFVRDGDFVEAMTKTVVFSTVFLLIALNEGLNARGGSEGIGRAATQAVVRGSVSVIALDFALTYGFYAL